jgi:nucleoside-diphosphate-sugar epimerase
VSRGPGIELCQRDDLVLIPATRPEGKGFEECSGAYPDISKIESALGWRRTAVVLDEILRDAVQYESRSILYRRLGASSASP